MIGYFYDIESLDNVFTLAIFKREYNEVDIYYLIDNEQEILSGRDYQTFFNEARSLIYEKNKNFTGTVRLLDLKQDQNILSLAETFGLSDATYINDETQPSSYPSNFRLTCDTDPDYDENKHPYLLGYNSDHYDTTMLTLYLYDSIKEHGNKIFHISAQTMRRYNDELFSDQFKNSMENRLKYSYRDNNNPSKGYTSPDYKAIPYVIRKNMLMSGRHIDVSRLNEKMQMAALKRVLGMLGYQILESDKLKPGQAHIDTYEQLLELIAYNISDTVNLAKLFEHKSYQSSFTLKKQLLKTYPELVYKEKDNTYKPDISTGSVRNDRLIITSTSAKFATLSLCPYGHLKDYPVVSFMYPAKEIAEQLNIEPVNVLEESKKFFYENFQQPELREKFDTIYDYYKQIEGKNFNTSKNYLIDNDIDVSKMDIEQAVMKLQPALQPHNINEIPLPNTCLYYYNKDGSPSSCFVNFSIGGIHGAEFNSKLYEADLKIYEVSYLKWYNEKIIPIRNKNKILEKLTQAFPDPSCLINSGFKKTTPISEILDDPEIKDFAMNYKLGTFLTGKKGEPVSYKSAQSEPKPPKKPELFVKNKKGYNLHKRYTYTSADACQHEDFTSYYPNLLRMMRAFWNEGLGYDRYGEIFDNKTKYGKMMKDKEHYSNEERELYSVMREGTKLILNSASGAANARYDSNIIMSNKIISMRIIGQLFTWRIGQAQTIAGASIPSTNTDGLYSARIDADYNNAILAREAEIINVEIEPEPIFLISKDSNNRAEIEIEGDHLGKVVGANGGSLAAQKWSDPKKGPSPDKNLSHPAIIDWSLSEYLILASTHYKNLSLNKPFDRNIGMSILKSARSQFKDDMLTLIMFQTIVASSPGTQRFVFATEAKSDEINPIEEEDDDDQEETFDSDSDSDDDDTTSLADKIIKISEKPIQLQHYNRCFIVKDDIPNTYHIQIAAAKVITADSMKKRQNNNEPMRQNDPIAIEMLKANGIRVESLPMNKEAAAIKLPGISNLWHISIDNRDLHYLDETQMNIMLNNLDYEKYLTLLENAYMKNWFNKTPEWLEEQARIKQAKKQPKKSTNT